MAINPDNITTIRVDQLPEDTLALVNEFAHTNGTELKKATIQSLVDLVAAAVGAGSGVGFLPISVTDGQQLPDVPADPSFFLAGIGTYLNINGFPDLICTEELNAIMSLTDHWEIAVEIPINAEIGVQSVTGSAVDNTDPLNPIVNLGGGSSTTPTLQQVTDVGNETTNQIKIQKIGLFNSPEGDYNYIEVSEGDWYFKNAYTDRNFVINSERLTSQKSYLLPDENSAIQCFNGVDSDKIAENFMSYSANGTIIFTDPYPSFLAGYIVHVIDGTTTIGGVDYTSGALVYRFYNGTDWISTDMNAGGGATKTSDLINDGDDGNPFISLLDLPSNIIFYPTNVASDISGYVKIVTSITDPSYNTTAVDVSTGAITTTSQLISSLATSPNIIVGNPGVFNITTIGNIRRTSGSGTASFYFQVYKRTSGGTETLIATSANTIPVLDSGTYVEFSSTAIWDDGIFLDTDRVVMKYYANRIAGGSNPTYQFQFGGVTPVRTLVPIPLSVVPILTIDAVPTDGSTNAVSSNGVFDALALKVDKTSWIDISATSTIVGFATFFSKFIYYKIIDNYIIVDFALEGTSNSTLLTFTVPFNNTSGFTNYQSGGYGVNSGVASNNPPRIGIVNNTNLVVCNTTLSGGVYAITGNKGCIGSISFKIN
jgi:hypothetical protein